MKELYDIQPQKVNTLIRCVDPPIHPNNGARSRAQIHRTTIYLPCRVRRFIYTRPHFVTTTLILTPSLYAYNRPDGLKKAYVRLAQDSDALDVANKIGVI